MNYPALVNAALFSAGLAMPGLRKAAARAWMPLIILIALLDNFVTQLPLMSERLQFAGSHWNWSGKLLNLAAMLLAANWLCATRRLTAADIGLTLRQAPGTGRALLTVIVPYLALLVALTATLLGSDTPPARETLAYEATLPGLAEELSYRGVQLALFNKLFARRFQVLGAQIGYGAIAISIVFGLLHGAGFDNHFHLQFSPLVALFTGLIGFVLAWLRERTSSLVLPVIVHNATNLILEGVPRLF